MNNLDERRKKILWAIVQSHIDLNVPIGSIVLAKRLLLGISSATVRNTMSQLEEMGYITQPHTSAGRVPTEKGYRFYIDTLLEEQTFSVNSDMSHELSSRLSNMTKDSKMIIREAAKTLSSFSSYLAIATPFNIEDIIFKRIKFIKYESRKVLSILISDEGIFKNRIVELDASYSQKQLDVAADYVNSKFSGFTVRKVRKIIADQLKEEKSLCDNLIANLLYLCKEIIRFDLDEFSLNDLSGTSNLPDFATMKQIKAILKAIEDKHFMLKLLQQINDSSGTQVFLGMENIIPSMEDLSMVVAPYNKKKLACGAIGIIGPTRMNYKKLIPIVDHTAKALTKIFSEF